MRYAILYFFLLIVFLVIMIAPAVVGPMLGNSLKSLTSLKVLNGTLFQPTGYSQNNTNGDQTGTGNPSGGGGADASATASSGSGSSRLLLF